MYILNAVPVAGPPPAAGYLSVVCLLPARPIGQKERSIA